MTTTSIHGGHEPPLSADEQETPIRFLGCLRATFTWPTTGSDAAGMRTTFSASTAALGGMAGHLALVTDHRLPESHISRVPREESVDRSPSAISAALSEGTAGC